MLDVNVGDPARRRGPSCWQGDAADRAGGGRRADLHRLVGDRGARGRAVASTRGKALVNSVTAEDERLDEILPLVARHGAAVIGLANDETGSRGRPHKRLECARKIVAAANDHGIPTEDVIIDPLAMTGRRRHRGGDDDARDDLA